MPCTIIWYARLVLCGLEEDWEQTRPTDARGRSLEILLAWARAPLGMEVLRTRRAHAYRSRRAALICQTSHEKHDFGTQSWTSCPAGTRKAEGSAALPSRVQQRCPRAPSPEPCKGRRPKNRHSKKGETCFCSGSWPACAWSLLVPVRWFSGPAPSGSCLFLFRLMFLFTGRGRHVPAPSGRDVGSSSEWAPTQEPELGTDPRTGFFRYPSTQYAYIFSAMYEEVWLGFGLGYLVIFTTADDFTLKCVGDVFSQYWVTGHFWFLVSPSPLHDRGGARWRPHHFWMLLLSHSSHLRRFHSVSRHPSFGWL